MWHSKIFQPSKSKLFSHWIISKRLTQVTWVKSSSGYEIFISLKIQWSLGWAVCLSNSSNSPSSPQIMDSCLFKYIYSKNIITWQLFINTLINYFCAVSNSFEFEINLIAINFIRKLIRNLNFECDTAKLAKKFQVHKITVPYKFFFYSLHFIYLWKKLIKNVNRGRSPQVFALLVI